MELIPPCRIGEYVLLEALGRGSAGAVFIARTFDRSRAHIPLCIKILTPKKVSPEELASRFRHEARVASCIDNPHVVTIYSIESIGGFLAILMELIEGWTVAKLLGAFWDRSQPPPIPAVVDCITQVLDGIEALRTAVDPSSGRPLSVVHRDLSPKNLLVDARGHTKIIDFGLGTSTLRELEDDPARTSPGMIMGAPGYMSPEQANGLPADHRSDLYAAGVIMYEMLALDRYISRSTTAEQLIRSAQNPTYRPLSNYRADVSPSLEKILEKMLARNPDDRFRTAGDVLEAFRAEMPEAESRGALGRFVESLIGRELEPLPERTALVPRVSLDARITQVAPMLTTVLARHPSWVDASAKATLPDQFQLDSITAGIESENSGVTPIVFGPRQSLTPVVMRSAEVTGPAPAAASNPWKVVALIASAVSLVSVGSLAVLYTSTERERARAGAERVIADPPIIQQPRVAPAIVEEQEQEPAEPVAEPPTTAARPRKSSRAVENKSAAAEPEKVDPFAELDALLSRARDAPADVRLFHRLRTELEVAAEKAPADVRKNVRAVITNANLIGDVEGLARGLELLKAGK